MKYSKKTDKYVRRKISDKFLNKDTRKPKCICDKNKWCLQDDIDKIYVSQQIEILIMLTKNVEKFLTKYSNLKKIQKNFKKLPLSI